MRPKPQFPVDLVTFTGVLEKSLIENFIFCAVGVEFEWLNFGFVERNTSNILQVR